MDGRESEPSRSGGCLSFMCTRFRPPGCDFAVLVMVAGCGVVSPPPLAPPIAVEPKAAVSASAPQEPSAPGSPPTEIPKAATKPEAPKAAPAKPATPQAAKSAPPTPPAPIAAKAPVLDLRSLEQRLKDTSAIGVLTKLSLKNQVDDLVAQFRAFHDGRRPPTLTELRRPFELLLMKVLSLLQDQDPALANQINTSREAIWGLLSDRDKLAPYL